MRDTDRDWREVARTDPYWGVISVDRFKGRMLKDADLKSFFQSGDAYLEQVLVLIRRLLDPNFEIKRALDFGCGVGRLAVPIARAAKGDVVAMDVAPDMLRLCDENARHFGVRNLAVVESDDELSKARGAFNFVNTYIVLQHIPPARGCAIIENLLSKLEMNGVASIQLTYAKAIKFLKHEEARAGYYRLDGDSIIGLSARKDPRPEGSITMYDYDLNKVMAILQAATNFPMIVRPTDDDGHIGVHVLLKRVR